MPFPSADVLTVNTNWNDTASRQPCRHLWCIYWRNFLIVVIFPNCSARTGCITKSIFLKQKVKFRIQVRLQGFPFRPVGLTKFKGPSLPINGRKMVGRIPLPELMWNTHCFIQYLNSGLHVHFLQRKTLHYEPLLHSRQRV